MNKICYIVGAGEGFVSFAPRECDLVIAADGGYDRLAERGIRTDLFVGDMDSLGVPVSTEVIRYPVRKDETDTALAYRAGRERGYTRFVLLSCVGGRTAHTFANFALLAEMRREGMRALLVGERESAFVMMSERLTLSRPEGRYLSLFAYGGTAYGLTLTGLSYPLSGYTLSPDAHIGVSNAFTAETATVSVEKGCLLVFCERREGEPIDCGLLDGFFDVTGKT